MTNPRYANGARRRALRARILREEDTCGICGHDVDKELLTPHPLSPEIDEIVPIAHGGDPYDRDNCRLAHRVCNRCRSTGQHHGFCIACQNADVTNDDCGSYAYDDNHAPAGQHCNDCNGIHHPRPGVAFETSRTW
ncbi:hypothetical protein CRM90_09010 [Mycobacterium sp. ENV421]|uniref:HNH endonuclease n=1 Tax=Mycobacterium sp. ENV421 TaxID=1213407 RepID=UPI000C9ACC79|nr:HNH endonuclease signature motif containing protein [Mycobacterium sp. ENV421]PND58120.1 hypothetical protein CRM90_09010 [Mycobacterium sp. ENV421]